MDKLNVCKGSLAQFDHMIWAYRAEVEYEGKLYKFWKEYGISRRLEVFTPGDICPSENYRLVVYGDERKHIPQVLWEAEVWEIYNLMPLFIAPPAA